MTVCRVCTATQLMLFVPFRRVFMLGRRTLCITYTGLPSSVSTKLICITASAPSPQRQQRQHCKHIVWNGDPCGTSHTQRPQSAPCPICPPQGNSWPPILGARKTSSTALSISERSIDRKPTSQSIVYGLLYHVYRWVSARACACVCVSCCRYQSVTYGAIAIIAAAARTATVGHRYYLGFSFSTIAQYLSSVFMCIARPPQVDWYLQSLLTTRRRQ